MVPSKSEVNRHVERILRAARADAEPPPPGMARHVHASWKRSLDTYRLDPARRGRPRVLEHKEVCERRERFERLLRVSRPSVADLHVQLHGSGYCVILADRQGATLDFRGVPALDKELQSFGLRTGTCWAERDEGTGAIGVALAERVPIRVHRDEHFRAHNIAMSCSAVPIFDADESLLGVLDATALGARDGGQLAFQLVTRCATMIENALFADEFRHVWTLAIGGFENFVDSGSEQLVAFDEGGRIVGANRAARLALLDGAGHAPLDALFDFGAADLIHHAHRWPGATMPLRRVRDGQRLHVRMRAPARPPAARAPAAPASAQLGDLVVHDEGLIDTVTRLHRLVDGNMPILLLGETGCGKEMFARAIHRQSRRREGPFVALNCAALPEGLIESELFGYQGGAFTGAKAQGEKGKIQLAAGGTLFLDEIGDMPLHLQTRLLRVLSEGEFLPLGATRVAQVDLHVVCATHRDLPAMVAAGTFREDLYFRLNAATFRIPPLRERSDRREVIRCLFERERAAQRRDCLMLAEPAAEALAAYAWPGNVRQLRNALRYAIAMCVESTLVTLGHFPADVAAGARAAHGGADPAPSRTRAAAQLKAQAGEERERAEILAALKLDGWHMSRAAHRLGISRTTLYRKLKRFGVLAAASG